MPGRRSPPVAAPIFASPSSRAARRASLMAATMRSCNISTSAGSTADGSMVTLTSFWSPVATAFTTPPPADPSTVAAASSCLTRSIDCCICIAIRCRLAMPMLSPPAPLSAGGLRRLLEVWPKPRSAARPKDGRPNRRLGDASRLAHVSDVNDVIAVDAAELGQEPRAIGVLRQSRELDICGHAADRNRHTQDATHAVLQDWSPPLGHVLEEALSLWKAEGDDGPFNANGTAGHNQRLGGWTLADDLDDFGPALEEKLQGRPGAIHRCRGHNGWRRWAGRRRFGGRGRT